MLKKVEMRLFTLLALAASFMGLSVPAQAATDFTGLTDAVDFTSVVTAVLAVAAALVVVYIAWKGAQMILSAVRRG